MVNFKRVALIGLLGIFVPSLVLADKNTAPVPGLKYQYVVPSAADFTVSVSPPGGSCKPNQYAVIYGFKNAVGPRAQIDIQGTLPQQVSCNGGIDPNPRKTLTFTISPYQSCLNGYNRDPGQNPPTDFKTTATLLSPVSWSKSSINITYGRLDNPAATNPPLTLQSDDLSKQFCSQLTDINSNIYNFAGCASDASNSNMLTCCYVLKDSNVTPSGFCNWQD